MAKKRKNGQGTVRLRKDGRWEGRHIVGYDENGKPKLKSVLAKTKAECVEKLKKLQTESAIKKLKDNQLRQDYEDARAILDRIPPEILRQYRSRANNQKQEIHR